MAPMPSRFAGALQSPTALGMVFALLAAIAYSTMDVTGKLAYRSGMTVPTLLSLRFLGAGAAVLVAWRLWGRHPAPRGRAVRFFLLGAFGYATESVLLNSAISRMPVSAVVLIFYTYPSMVALLSFTLGRERFGLLKTTALALSAVGVVLVLGFPTSGVTVAGAALAFGAAIAFAVYAVIAEREMADADRMLFSGLVLLGAGVSITLVGTVTGGIHLHQAVDAPGWVVLHAFLIATGVIAFLVAVTHLGAPRASIGNTLEPALTVALAAAVVGEQLRGMQLLGAALLLTAIALLPLTRRGSETALEVPVHE